MSEKRITVRGYHLDLYNHVNHARYLEFLEEARWAYLEEKHPVEWFVENGIGFVIANININYKRPALLNNVLLISSKLAKTGTKSIVVEQVIHLDGTDTIIADALVTFVLVDLKTGKSMPLNDELISLFS
jgi:thioesterase III